jgi:hypothetical protein
MLSAEPHQTVKFKPRTAKTNNQNSFQSCGAWFALHCIWQMFHQPHCPSAKTSAKRQHGACEKPATTTAARISHTSRTGSACCSFHEPQAWTPLMMCKSTGQAGSNEPELGAVYQAVNSLVHPCTKAQDMARCTCLNSNQTGTETSPEPELMRNGERQTEHNPAASVPTEACQGCDVTALMHHIQHLLLLLMCTQTATVARYCTPQGNHR